MPDKIINQSKKVENSSSDLNPNLNPKTVKFNRILRNWRKKFDREIGRLPFAGRLLTSNAIPLVAEKNLAQKDIKINIMLTFLVFLIQAHARQAFIPLPKIQQIIPTISQISLEKSTEILKTLLRIGYLIVNLLVSLSQASLFLRMLKFKGENKIKVLQILAEFGIGGQKIDQTKFIEKLIELILTENDEQNDELKRELDVLIYFLDAGQIEILSQIMIEISQLEEIKFFGLEEICSFLEKENIPKERLEIIKKASLDFFQIQFSVKETLQMMSWTLAGQSILEIQ